MNRTLLVRIARLDVDFYDGLQSATFSIGTSGRILS
jgi:hypothetical protein